MNEEEVEIASSHHLPSSSHFLSLFPKGEATSLASPNPPGPPPSTQFNRLPSVFLATSVGLASHARSPPRFFPPFLFEYLFFFFPRSRLGFFLLLYLARENRTRDSRGKTRKGYKNGALGIETMRQRMEKGKRPFSSSSSLPIPCCFLIAGLLVHVRRGFRALRRRNDGGGPRTPFLPPPSSPMRHSPKREQTAEDRPSPPRLRPSDRPSVRWSTADPFRRRSLPSDPFASLVFYLLSSSLPPIRLALLPSTPSCPLAAFLKTKARPSCECGIYGNTT